MSLTASRRAILKFLGGSIAGVMVTPVPWKLLDDTAIWTQTGPWISKLPRGSVSSRYSTCTLCPAACGIRVRAVKGVPFAVHPVRNHPLSQGGLCATGTAGHHLPYHPLRLRTPVRIAQNGSLHEATPVSSEEIEAVVRTSVEKAGAGGVAVLDQRPGRTSSLFYRKVLKNVKTGLYVVAPSDESLMFEGLQALSRESLGLLGVDIEHAKLVVSFGVPVLENHGTLGRVTNTLANRSQKFIQIESGLSRTAVLADEWLPILPGTEAIVALGIANILLRRAIRGSWAMNVSYQKKVRRFTPSLVANAAGISEHQLMTLADEMATTKQVVVLGGPSPSTGSRSLSEDMAVWGLNLLLGQYGSEGGILERSDVPVPSAYEDSRIVPVTNLRDVPDGSLSVLLIDASQSGAPLPWKSLRRKLNPTNHVTVVLTPTMSGLARFADFAVPTAAPYEILTDTATPVGSVKPSFGMAAPILQPPTKVVDPVEFIGSLLGSRHTTEALLRERVERIHSSRRGMVFVPGSESTTAVRDLIAADDLATLLLEGGVWVDENIPQQKRHRFDVFGVDEKKSVASVRTSTVASKYGFPLVFEGRKNGMMHSQMPPITSKLVQESELWGSDTYVQMHPETANTAGVEEDMRVAVCAGSEERIAKVRFHSGLRPGIVQMAIGCSPVTIGADHAEFVPETLDLIEPDENLGWGGVYVVLRKV